jgi:hypothetical protein
VESKLTRAIIDSPRAVKQRVGPLEENYYRIWLAILATVALLVLGALAISLSLPNPERPAGVSAFDIGRLAGYGLLAVAAIGLWSWRSWGFWTLGLATLLTFGADVPNGIFSAFWRSFLHLTMILLTVEQHFARKIPDDEEEAE